MKNQKVISDARQAMAFLTRDMEFTGPELVDDNRVTSLRYTHIDFGVEVELDWRERDALVLIVRLSESRWPKGYYVDNGKKCRIHLENAIKNRNWPTTVPVEACHAKPSDERMVSEISRRARMLEEVLDHIRSEAASLFE